VDVLPGDPVSFVRVLRLKLFAITTTADAAAGAATEQVLFGRNFKLLKIEY